MNERARESEENNVTPEQLAQQLAALQGTPPEKPKGEPPAEDADKASAEPEVSEVPEEPIDEEIQKEIVSQLTKVGGEAGGRPAAELTTEEIRAELQREKKKHTFRRTLRSTILILLSVAAIAVLVSTLWLPVLQITGTSMEPTLENGEIVVAIKNSQFKQGDMVAFYYNNKILLKRVIAQEGDFVDIKDDGTVYVNEKALDEPYLTDKSLGECDITFPYQVPDGKIFVMGDHRSTSVDSRSTAVGCISDEFIVGRVVLRVWPVSRFGILAS